MIESVTATVMALLIVLLIIWKAGCTMATQWAEGISKC